MLRDRVGGPDCRLPGANRVSLCPSALSVLTGLNYPQPPILGLLLFALPSSPLQIPSLPLGAPSLLLPDLMSRSCLPCPPDQLWLLLLSQKSNWGRGPHLSHQHSCCCYYCQTAVALQAKPHPDNGNNRQVSLPCLVPRTELAATGEPGGTGGEGRAPRGRG